MARIAILLSLAAVLAAPSGTTSDPLPAAASAFLAANCASCHSGAQPQAAVSLDVAGIDWGSRESAAKWERVHDALESGKMPPEAAPQPSAADRQGVIDWLSEELHRHAGIGGEVPRRLNRLEYRNTIRDLFGIPDFALPDGFPADDSLHGFDNLGAGLVLSPPLMAQYLAVATDIADELLPPATGEAVAQRKVYRLEPADLAMEGGGHAVGDRFRLMSSRNMASAAAWPARFEARQSGIYRLSIGAAGFQTSEMFYEHRTEPFRVAVYARPKADQVYVPFGELRKVAEFELGADLPAPQTLAAEIELFEGETFGIRWLDGPAYSDPPKRDYSHAFLADRLLKDRLYYAAMLQYGGGPRGATQSQVYEATLALMQGGDLDLADPRLDKLPEVWGGGLSNAPHNWIKAFVHEELYRFGPAVDVTALEIEGPLRLTEDDATRERKARTRRFLGERQPGASDLEHAEAVLRRFLTSVLRRPPSDEQLQEYTDLVAGHLQGAADARLEDGLHLAVRRALVSPHFLYRGLRNGSLDEFDLASRLSYFLTSAPPDDRLAAKAADGSLSDPAVLAAEAERLIEDPRSEEFVRSFTGQWLSTRLLRGIMPDPRLIQFGGAGTTAMIEETELFFGEVMRENLPVETFIDPGFSYRNARLNRIYGANLEGNAMQRVTFERGGRFGGVLGLAAVMMATANGVDTHPVLRGVWVLENILGDPPPEPPPNVPAIAPDTSGATSLRQQIAAHRADPSCASCHDKIDPLGMVLENFDPVGRWRDNYPVYTKPPDGAEALQEEFYSTTGKGVAVGPPVDSIGTLADGTRLADVTDLKRYVLDRIDVFSLCLTEKLLVYATGRPLSFGDRRVAEQIVEEVARNGNGFRDLIVAVAQSESFASR